MIYLLCMFLLLFFFFFKQKTAYEMSIGDWSSDVCSSDLGGLDCCIAGVLASVCRTRVGSDDSDIALWHVKNTGQFVAIRKRPLCSSPYRKLALGELSHGSTGLERRVRDICNVVDRIEALRRAGESFFDLAFLPPEPLVRRGLRIVLDVREGFLAGYLRHFLPLRANGIERLLCFVCARRRDADEIAIAHNNNAAHGPRRAVITKTSVAPNDGGRRTLPKSIPLSRISFGAT